MTQKRLFAWLLALCLVLSCVPAGLAEGGSSASSMQSILDRLKGTTPTPAPTAAPTDAPAATKAPDAEEESPAEDSAPAAKPGAPVFVDQPRSCEVSVGAAVSFEASATSALKYLWQYSKDGGKTWNKLPSSGFTGASTTRLVFKATAKMNGWQFRLSAFNLRGTSYSNAAVLTIKGEDPAPVVTEAPAPVVTEAPAPVVTEAPAPVVTEAPAPTDEPIVIGSENDPFADYDPYGDVPAPIPTKKPNPLLEALGIQDKAITPIITGQPADWYGSVGQTASFSISATNAVRYQWQYSRDGMEPFKDLLNSGFWFGNRTANMSCVPRADQDGLWIRCAATSSDGVTTYSNAAQIHITKAPVITYQPLDQLNIEKNTKVPFQVYTPETGVTYQWYVRTGGSGTGTPVANGGNYSGATSNTLVVTAAVALNNCEYSCVVTNSAGSTRSNWAKLTIKQAGAPVIIGQPAPDPVACILGESVTVSVVAENATKYRWEYSKSTSYPTSRTGVLTSSSFWKGNTTDTLTFTPRADHNGMWIRCVALNDVNVAAESNWVQIVITSTPVMSVTTLNPNPATAGATVIATVAGTGATQYHWQVSADNGVTWTYLSWPGSTTPSMTFTAENAYDGYMFRCEGMNDAGSAYSPAVTLKVQKSVVIVNQPQDQTVGENTVATFDVTASGAAPLQYQWQRRVVGDNTTITNIPGATGSSYSLVATYADTAYEYRVGITNPVTISPVYSVWARLYVYAAPAIIGHPANITVGVGQKASFHVVADNVTGYQWQYSVDGITNWTNLTDGSYWVGNNASVLSFNAAAEYDGYYFRCIVSNPSGPVTSNAAQLRIISKPVFAINGMPISRTVSVGALVQMEVSILNPTADTTYRWQYYNGTKWVSLNNTAIYSGIYTDTLYFTAQKYMSGYRYRCMVKNSSGTSYSDPALLTVSAVIPPQPDAVRITGASYSSLTVAWNKVVADELNGYKIYYNTVNNPATATQFSIVDPSQKSITIIGLYPSTNYYVWVSAYNTAGESPLNSNVLAVGTTQFAATDLIAPQAPSNVRANVLGNSSARISWQLSPSSNVMGYSVYYATGSLTSNAKLYCNVGPTTNSVVLTGLNPGTKYYIWVSAYGEGGMSSLTDYVRAIFTTTGSPAYPIVPIVDGELPAPPINVAANRLTDNTAQVSWNRGSSANVTGYAIYMSTSSSPSGAKLYATTNASARSIQVNGLNANYGYYFWVASVNEVGMCDLTAYNRAYAAVLNPPVVVNPPLGPTNVAAGAVSSTSVSISWTRSASAQVDGYRIYVSTSSDPSTAKSFGTTNGTSVTVFNLRPFTRYYFWVVAYNDAGESPLNSSVRTYALTFSR